MEYKHLKIDSDVFEYFKKMCLLSNLTYSEFLYELLRVYELFI